MRGRAPTAGEGPPACPFVAFAEEADSRSGMPDHRHRCYAQEPPEPRAYAHQERYCLTSAYPGCAYFQDWAVRYAAESVAAPALVGAGRSLDDRAGFERAAPPQAHFDRAGRPTRPGRAAAAQLGAFDAYDPADGPQRGVEYPRARDYSDGANRARAAELESAVAARAKARTHTPVVNADSNGHGAPDPYSGYPTAARLLGITPPPVELDDDEAPEPGKWERSGRLQSWLEDAELGASRGRFAAEEEVQELEAGVIATRPSQARRAAMPAASPAARANNARPALPWERRTSPEPQVAPRRSSSVARISPILVGAVALVLTALVLFVLPGLLPLGGGQKRSNAAVVPPSPRATATPTEPPPSVAPAQPTPRTYRVAKGDTLSRIASRFGTTVRDLLDANPEITDARQIHIGQKVTIPPS